MEKKKKKKSAELSVLVATSDGNIQTKILEVLDKKKYTTVVANNCKQTLEKILHQEFDAVILDPELNILDGSDSIELIKKMRPKIHMIVFSDDSSYETGVKIAKAGVYFRLLKPVDEQVTTELIDSLEEKVKKEREQLDIK